MRWNPTMMPLIIPILHTTQPGTWRNRRFTPDNFMEIPSFSFLPQSFRLSLFHPSSGVFHIEEDSFGNLCLHRGFFLFR